MAVVAGTRTSLAYLHTRKNYGCGSTRNLSRNCIVHPLRKYTWAVSSTEHAIQVASGGVSELKSDENNILQLYNEEPRLYDLAVNFRDFEKEVDFLLQAAEKHCGVPVQSALELAAGPASHALEMARRGIESAALDSQPSMVEYGRNKAAAAGLELQYVCGDMADFNSVPTQGGRVQLVSLLFGSAAHLITNDQFIGCLRSCRSVLDPGGVVVLELPHPKEVFEVGQWLGDAWEVRDAERDTVLLVGWGGEDDAFDPLTQVVQRRVTFNEVNRQGDVVTSKEFVLPQRLHTKQEVDALARASGFRVEQYYGAMDFDVELDDPEEAFRMVVVLKPE